MKIELKNIKHSELASEETHFYQATLYVDGKRIGEVSNDGNGGSDMFHGDRAAYEAADAWLKANVPPTKLDVGDGKLVDIECDIEMRCGELVNDFLATRDMRRTFAHSVAFVTPSLEGLRVLKHQKQQDRYIKAIKAKYPDVQILNTLPVADALALWRKHG